LRERPTSVSPETYQPKAGCKPARSNGARRAVRRALALAGVLGVSFTAAAAEGRELIPDQAAALEPSLLSGDTSIRSPRDEVVEPYPLGLPHQDVIGRTSAKFEELSSFTTEQLVQGYVVSLTRHLREQRTGQEKLTYPNDLEYDRATGSFNRVAEPLEIKAPIERHIEAVFARTAFFSEKFPGEYPDLGFPGDKPVYRTNADKAEEEYIGFVSGAPIKKLPFVQRLTGEELDYLRELDDAKVAAYDEAGRVADDIWGPRQADAP